MKDTKVDLHLSSECAAGAAISPRTAFSSRTNRYISLSMAALLASVATPCYAQASDTSPGGQSAPDESGTPADSASGEIVVTATRQATSLSKVPMSVAAITPQQMDTQGLRNINDITRVTPGIALTPASNGAGVAGTNQVISIRGISSVVGSPTTGIYIDDTPIQGRPLGSANNVYPQLFDLERVEVLRGPQGTLFGAGAEGGAIRFITPRPGMESSSGYARGELAFTHNGAPTYEFGNAYGGPVIKDRLAFRVSAWYRREGGYINEINEFTKQVTDKAANNHASYALRGALAWKVSDALSATFSTMYQNEQQDDNSSFYTTVSNPGKSDFNATRVFPSPSHNKFVLSNLDLRYDGAAFDVISSTSYFNHSSDLFQDYTHFISSVLFGFPYLFPQGSVESANLEDHQKNWTQEIRIQSHPGGRLNWVVGGFYGHSTQTSYQLNNDPNLNALLATFGVGPLPLLPGDHALQQTLGATDVQKAAFGQADYELIDGLKLTAGVRVAKVDVSAFRNAIGPIAGANASYSSKTSETPVTPKFGVSYQATGNTLLYATAGKGYRIGGINGPQLSFCDSTLAQIGLKSTPGSYKSDSLWSYEVGAKSKLFGGRLNVAASAFDIRWKNIQQLVSIAACKGSFIVNVGAARSVGFDLALDFRLNSNLKIGASVGYAHAYLTEDFQGTPGASGTPTYFARKGDRVGGPPLTATVSGDYEQPFGDDRTGYLHADFQHVSQGPEIDYTVFGTDPQARRSDSFDQLNVRLGLRLKGLDLSAFATNVLDKAPIISRFRGSLGAQDNLFTATTIRPRTIGVTGTYRY
jgi:outer membrane receptor protein involved in Fe transport